MQSVGIHGILDPEAEIIGSSVLNQVPNPGPLEDRLSAEPSL